MGLRAHLLHGKAKREADFPTISPPASEEKPVTFRRITRKVLGKRGMDSGSPPEREVD